MRRLRLTHALTAVALLVLCWTWVDAREQTAAQPRPATPAPAKPAPAKPVAASPAPTQSHKATLDRYCVTCHSDRLKTAGLTLESIDTTNISAAPDVWEKVVRKVGAGLMPPQGMPQPAPDSLNALTGFLQDALDRAAVAAPNPGRPMLHRLNRAEYANAIRDLLHLTVDTATLLPPDDSAYGFDNVADVLGVSPSLQERYLAAASKISALAVGDVGIRPRCRYARADLGISRSRCLV